MLLFSSLPHRIALKGVPLPCRSMCIVRSIQSGIAGSCDEDGRRLRSTQQWLESIVIGQKLCPFAAPVRVHPRLRLQASAAQSADALVSEVGDEADLLVEGLKRGPEAGLPETTLLVLDGQLPFVARWHDFVQLSWRLQSEAILAKGHEQQLQIVLFHPFAVQSAYGEGPPDAADYALRAPFPTVHLLREADMLDAVRAYPKASQIPSRNKRRLREQGIEVCEARLVACVAGDGDSDVGLVH